METARTWGIARLKELVGPAFFRNVFVVMTGTAVAQLIGFLFSPILSRLYGPPDFGEFGAYLSLTMVIVAAVTLNYSDTVMLPKEDREAAPLLLVACGAAVLIASGTAVFCLVASGPVLKLIGLGGLGRLVWFVPISVLLLGMSQSLASWCARVKAFKRTSQSQVLRSSMNCAAQTGGGLAGVGGAGLIAAGVLADASAAVFLGWAACRQSAAMIRAAAHWRALWHKALEYKEFAIYGTPQNVMNALSQGVPVLALAHYYGVEVAGYYAFGMRLLQVPMNFVLTSTRQVLFQRLSQIKANGGDLYAPFLKSTGALAAIIVVPAVIGFLAAPAVFGFVFGQQWREAGHYGRWLLLWLMPAFCNVPAALSLRILRLQRDLFFYDLGLLATRVGVLIAGGKWLLPIYTVITLSVAGAVFNTALILYIWWRLHKMRSWGARGGEEIAVENGNDESQSF
ncbi:MAG TPA: lipopolysaccharide biosynthesis protein [Verrucomicrobiae bacterium]|nr:lipopolysaccharide biosynthesis protein [Verrucomicrobiae bacterium]